jgi:hypothetical protein
MYSLWGVELLDDKKLNLSIKKRASDLVDQFKSAQITNNPVVWVCHSMGGLIAKQFMLNLHELGEHEMLNNMRAIVFLSTPHLGSKIAKTATAFSFATFPSTEIFELSADNVYLIDMNKKFLNMLEKLPELSKNLKVISMLEKMPTYIGLNIYTETVSVKSANIGVGEFITVENKDHLNICKPVNKQCIVYKKVIEAIQNEIEERKARCPACIKEQVMKHELENEKQTLEWFKQTSFI